jgi:Protein of unknown function DUF262.
MALLENRIINLRTLFELNPSLPSFSIPFSWEEERAERLLKDIISSFPRGEYRIGTFVVVEEGGERRLMDGEGRFVTLAVLLSLLKCPLAPALERPWTRKERERIKAVAETLKKALSYTDPKTLLAFLLDSTTALYIAVEREEEAFFFFDSAVSRGRALDPADLLKAYHLCAMREESEEEKLKAIASWERLSNEHLYSLFDSLYVLKRWLRKEVAVSFKTDGLSVFKGLNGEAYPYLHGLTEKPQSLFDPVINGKRFFEMARFYSKIYPKGLEREIEKVYPHLEHNFRVLGGYDNVGDMYAYKLFLSLLLLYADRFGYTDFKPVVKACFCFSFALRFDNPGFSWSSVNDYVLDASGFFHTIEYALTPYEIYSFDFEAAYPDLRNEVHPERGRIRKLDWANDFALYLGDEL